MLNFLTKILSLIPFIILLDACGKGVEISEVKDYVFYVETDNNDVRNEMKYLIAKFNSSACFPALGYTDNRNEATSKIEVVPGLKERDGKVGWGQWIRHSLKENPLFYENQDKLVVHSYSMNLQFDLKYFLERLPKTSPSDDTDLLVLFSHEAGHGLGKEHNDIDPSDVMYPNVSVGAKNLAAFFRTIYSYFENTTAADRPKIC